MATSAQKRITPQEIRKFGSGRELFSIPDLTQIQTRSYENFLQYDVPSNKRKDQGIESVLREIFPIESYDKNLKLEYLRYELGKPRYEPHECRQLRLTYGRPFRVWLRLTKTEPIEEEVYLGDIPIMLGGGEFIINGAERVVVSQLHRSPGVDFVTDTDTGERKIFSARIIPGARQLDRTERVEEGHAAGADRSKRQVFGDDAAAGDGPEVRAGFGSAAHVLRNDQRESGRRPQRRKD